MALQIAPLSKQHEKFLCSLHHKKYRQKEGLFTAEGTNVLHAALAAPQGRPQEIILGPDIAAACTRGEYPAGIPDGIPLYAATEPQMKRLSTEQSPQGTIVVCRIPAFDRKALFDTVPPCLVYLDRVADPGNLGTIIRSAVWFGVPHVLMGPQCAEAWNPKTVRSSAGTLFGCSLYPSVEIDDLFRLAEAGRYHTVSTTLSGDLPPKALPRDERTIVIFGNEAQGISEEILRRSSHRVTIPGARQAESLNCAAAAAIMLYELRGR